MEARRFGGKSRNRVSIASQAATYIADFPRNSSAQDFAFTAKSVKTCKLSQKNLPLAEGDLKWADSVTGKPKAELLLFHGILRGSMLQNVECCDIIEKVSLSKK